MGIGRVWNFEVICLDPEVEARLSSLKPYTYIYNIYIYMCIYICIYIYIDFKPRS